jgi:hypothetical protein
VSEQAGPDPLAALTELPGVFEATEAARGAVDALLRDLMGADLRRRGPEVSAEALRRGAWASAVLEGATGLLADFRPPLGDDRDGAIGRGALRVTGELGPLVPVWERAPLQALARLHTLAATELQPGAELGRPRPDPEVSVRLAGLADVLALPTSAPAVVVAAVVHGEVLAVAPFAWGSGLVARAAARLVLLSRGLDPRAASIPEAGILELGPEGYREALDRYRSGTPDGVADWLVFVATATGLGARVGRQVCADLLAAG